MTEVEEYEALWADELADMRDERQRRVRATRSIQLGNLIEVVSLGATTDTTAVQLVSGNLTEMGSDLFAPGGWNLTISVPVCEIDEPSVVVADIKAGNGGTYHEFEVSVYPECSIFIPANDVSVSCYVKGATAAVPGTCKIIGTLKPATSGGAAKRLINTFELSAITPGGVVNVAGTNYDIPAFAKDMMIYTISGNMAALFALPTALTLTGNTFGSIDYTGAQIQALYQSGGRVPIPGGYNMWRYNAALFPFVATMKADFTIEL